MIKVIGVRFRKAGKIYYFDPAGMDIEQGQHVIVETARGVEYGLVVLGVKEVAEDEVVQPLKQVIRVATAEDDETSLKNKEKEKKAFQICLEKIKKHGLEMKLIDTEYTFDNNKVLFYFTADGRIDFRELVKDLAAIFKTRIELRQIGVRDETKAVGGIGTCGRSLCCHTFLSDFAPVSIKMAKDQNLSLNPTKISGVCGRLVKDLAAIFKTRIELRQIGVRDETKAVGGIGTCGRSLCCHTFLSDFAPVSIKMAKDQNLSLNPTKISGVCGRLMCCLKNEEDIYEELNSKLPNVGDIVTTDEGLKGEVISVTALRQNVKVIVEINDEKEIREYKVDRLKFKPKRRKENLNISDAELKELEALERQEGKSKFDD